MKPNIAAHCCVLGALLGVMVGAGAQEVSAQEVSARDTLRRYSYRQVHMGMQTRLVLYARSSATARPAARAAFTRIASLEDVLSSYRSDSELMRLSRRAGKVAVSVSEALFDVLACAQTLARQSGGAFDATVGPYAALWRKARRTGQRPASDALERADSLVGWRKVHLDEEARTVQLQRAEMELDLGALAKGYILDRALETLAEHGIERALVEAGGDLVVSQSPPGQNGWRVEVPGAGPQGTADTLAIAQAAVSTSGNTYQFVEIGGTRYSHVVDPRTGWGLTHHLLATVVAPRAMLADGLSTTLGVLGEEKGRRFLRTYYPQAEAYIRPAPRAKQMGGAPSPKNP